MTTKNKIIKALKTGIKDINDGYTNIAHFTFNKNELETIIECIKNYDGGMKKDKSSSADPKDIVFGGWHLCEKCGKPVINGKKCAFCDKNPFKELIPTGTFSLGEGGKENGL